jgi:hypothetical protein
MFPAMLQAYPKKKAQSPAPLRIPGDCASLPLCVRVFPFKGCCQAGKAIVFFNSIFTGQSFPLADIKPFDSL